MATNVVLFGRFVRRLSKKLLPNQFIVFHKKLAMDVLTGIVDETPVDTGRLRGNWQATVDKRPSEETGIEASGEKGDAGGGPVKEAGSRTINEGLNKIGQVVYITNNVNYASFIEEGTSKMKARKMVARTLGRLMRS